MKRIVPVIFFLVTGLLLTACSPQVTPVPEMVGERAPNFTLDNALGGQYSLVDREGKPVLLYFHMAVG